MNLKQIRVLNFAKLLLVMFVLVSCSDNKATLTPLAHDAVILAYGDSLTFGLGANVRTQSYPAVLQNITGITVINAGISGEVTAQGLKRLPLVLDAVKPNIVILCHGGNDLIRRIGKEQLKNNLNQMIKLIQRSGADVVLVGVPTFNLMLTVPDLYSELAEAHKLPIDIELLPTIERDPKMKSDQIHPNAAGYSVMATAVQTLLLEAGAL